MWREASVHANAEAKLPTGIGKRNMFRWGGRILWIVLMTACEPDARAENQGQRLVVADVILTVANQSPQAVRVSLELDTLDHLLGDVSSSASRSFSLPSAVVGTSAPLRLKAIHDGVPPVRSDTFEIQRGQKVVWTFSGTGRGHVVKY